VRSPAKLRSAIALPSGHKVFCLWPHSLQAYSTRPWPTSAVTRLGAPHLLHFTSSRVLPRVMVTFFAIASLTKRSDSWRMASLDIVGTRGLRIVSSITQQFQGAISTVGRNEKIIRAYIANHEVADKQLDQEVTSPGGWRE
jgi:hypothetical protein